MAVIVTEHFDKGDILYTREEVDVRRMRTPYKSEFFSGPMYSYFALIKRVDFIPHYYFNTFWNNQECKSF